jgi:hypothetical protein
VTAASAVTLMFSLLSLVMVVAAKYYGDRQVRRSAELASRLATELVQLRNELAFAQADAAHWRAYQDALMQGAAERAARNATAAPTGYSQMPVGDWVVSFGSGPYVTRDGVPLVWGAAYGMPSDDAPLADPRDVRCAGSRLDGDPCRNFARRGREHCRRCELRANLPQRAIKIREEQQQ